VLEPCIKGQKENLTRIPLISYRNIHRESVKQVTKIGLMYKVGSFLAKYSSTHKRVRTLRSDADPLVVFRLFPQVE
jgi:hypothetical protein